MPLERLARELEETARQTAAMAEGVTDALRLLSGTGPCEDARAAAIKTIIAALQGQDRIEQRCDNMAIAVRRFAALPAGAAPEAFDAIWESLVLDELRIPALSGVAARGVHGEVELF